VDFMVGLMHNFGSRNMFAMDEANIRVYLIGLLRFCVIDGLYFCILSL